MSDPPLVRVRLKYPDLDTFVERFAPNVTRGGVFLTSREPRPVGSVVSFAISLETGNPVLVGQGRVTWVKPFAASEPRRPHGMGVQFTRLDPACRPLLERLLDRRASNLRRTGGVLPAPLNDRGPAWGAGGASRPVSGVPEPPEAPAATDFERVDEALVKRAVDRARVLSSRGSGEVEALLAPEPVAARAPSFSEALAGLARYLPSRRAAARPPAPSPVTEPEQAQVATAPEPERAQAITGPEPAAPSHAPASFEQPVRQASAAAGESPEPEAEPLDEPIVATSGDGT